MKRSIVVCLIGALLTSVGIGSVGIAIAQTSTESANTRPSWQPVARLSQPKFPVRVEIVNQTDLVLDYGLTNASPDQPPSTIAPKGKTVISLSDPEDLISINHNVVGQGDQVTYLAFKPTVLSNSSVRFVVTKATKRNQPGVFTGQVINIQRTGGIFIY